MTIEDHSFSFPDKETFICDECGEMRYTSEGFEETSEGVVCAYCKPPLYEKEEVEEEKEKKSDTKEEEELLGLES